MDSLLALATITQASNIEEMVNQRIHGRAAAEDLEEKVDVATEEDSEDDILMSSTETLLEDDEIAETSTSAGVSLSTSSLPLVTSLTPIAKKTEVLGEKFFKKNDNTKPVTTTTTTTATAVRREEANNENITNATNNTDSTNHREHKASSFKIHKNRNSLRLKKSKKKRSKKRINEVIQQKKRLYHFVNRSYTSHMDTAGTVPRAAIEEMHGGNILSGEKSHHKENEQLLNDVTEVEEVEDTRPTFFSLPQVIPENRICTRIRARREFEKALTELFPALESRWPTLGGTHVDFLTLYSMVTKDGGYENFHALRKWQKYCKLFKVPATCTSSGNHLSAQYLKYLMPIEEMFTEWCEEKNINWKEDIEKKKKLSKELKEEEKQKENAKKKNLKKLPPPPPVVKDWVQCIICEKWRVVAPNINVESLPDNWECKDNTWAPQYGSCIVLEEDYSDEIESGNMLLSATIPNTVETLKQIDVKINGGHENGSNVSTKVLKANVSSTFFTSNSTGDNISHTKEIRVKIKLNEEKAPENEKEMSNSRSSDDSSSDDSSSDDSSSGSSSSDGESSDEEENSDYAKNSDSGTSSGSSSSDSESDSDSGEELEELEFIYGPDVDASLQNAGAIAANMPLKKMSEDEKLYFPKFKNEPTLKIAYLEARNHILLLWLGNVEERLTLFEVLQGVESHSIPLIASVYEYLETKGKINYGCFKEKLKKEAGPLLTRDENTFKGKVCVLGAGIAGLITARQLKYFGYDVEIIEARDRIGGRVLTVDRPFKRPVDLGAMITTGIVGNPCHLLTRQLKLKEYELKVSKTSKLYYGKDGKPVEAREDEVGDYLFNDLLSHATENRLRYRKEEEDEKFEREWKEQEREESKRLKVAYNNANDNSMMTNIIGQNMNTAESSNSSMNHISEEYEESRSGRKRKRVDYSKTSVTIDEAINDMEKTHKMLLARMTLEQQKAKNNNNGNTTNRVTDVAPSAFENSYFKDMMKKKKKRTGWQKDDSDIESDEEDDKVFEANLKKMYANIDNAGSDISLGRAMEKAHKETLRSQPSTSGGKNNNFQHWSQQRELLIEWFKANLEFGCAAELEKVSNTYWDQDDASLTAFTGPHVVIDGGYGQLCTGLAKGLNIRLQSPVKAVKYDQSIQNTINGNSSTRVTTTTTTTTTTKSNSKNTIILENGIELKCDLIVCTVPLGCLQHGDIEFTPKFSPRKTRAIEKMGAGNLNKVVLEFNGCFWDPNDDMFGRVGESGQNRGHAYMFASFVSEKSAVLVAFMAGNAAQVMETKSDNEVIDSVLKVLKQMYGDDKVAEPISSHVSMWGSDKYARGAYSYVAVGCNGDDYDALSESINQNLYFAGEHCSRSNPTTCAGAMMSGLLCAEEIVRHHGRWRYSLISDILESENETNPKLSLGLRRLHENDH